MISTWRRMLAWQIPLLLLLAGGLGVLTRAYGWSLALVLALYLGWLLSNLARLWGWLAQAKPDSELPEMSGLCGELMDDLHNLQRHQLERQKKLERFIERGRESAEIFPDALVLVDAAANLLWWNLAAERLLGLKRGTDKGLPVTYVLRYPQFRDYFFNKQAQRQPLDLVSPLNHDIKLQLTIANYGDDDHMLLVRDVTRMQQLQQVRKDFVANASHELRTPLTVIIGYLETLETMLENGGDPRWQRPVQSMQQQAMRMQNLLDDLLLLSRLEIYDDLTTGQPVKVARLLGSIVADAQVVMAKKNHKVSVEADKDLELRGNEDELRSAFANLVMNAFKYTPDGGEIHVHWGADEDGGASVEVSDNGPGIDPKHLPHLTERFYRVEGSHATSTGGTGLGLAIVKHVLQRHGGRLVIDSQVGEGSCFICKFDQQRVTHKR